MGLQQFVVLQNRFTSSQCSSDAHVPSTLACSLGSHRVATLGSYRSDTSSLLLDNACTL